MAHIAKAQQETLPQQTHGRTMLQHRAPLPFSARPVDDAAGSGSANCRQQFAPKQGVGMQS